MNFMMLLFRMLKAMELRHGSQRLSLDLRHNSATQQNKSPEALKKKMWRQFSLRELGNDPF
jgi:hypothetical protein